MFKVGDIVRANRPRYIITTEKSVCKVLEVINKPNCDDNLLVEVLKAPPMHGAAVGRQFYVNMDYFCKISPSIR